MMKDHFLAIMWKVLGMVMMLASYQMANAAHQVSTEKVEAVISTIHFSLLAEVQEKALADKIDSDERRSYHLSIELPIGLIPDLTVDSYVRVTLPTIHHNEALAKVISVSKNRVELFLTNQIQQLEGQRLKVDLPFKPIHLFRIPFQAIYSPRGLAPQVFVVSSDMRARLVPISPLNVTGDGGVMVSSDHLKDAVIVVQGTDNLLSGDEVQSEKLMRAAL